MRWADTVRGLLFVATFVLGMAAGFSLKPCPSSAVDALRRQCDQISRDVDRLAALVERHDDNRQ